VNKYDGEVACSQTSKGMKLHRIYVLQLKLCRELGSLYSTEPECACA
jgi:hypothetical protein